MILITIDLLDIAFLAWWRIEQAILQCVQIGVGDALSAIAGGQSTDDVVPLRAKLHFTIATAYLKVRHEQGDRLRSQATVSSLLYRSRTSVRRRL